jgi:multicomponent Na+:H+ antiporter subunit B
VVEALAGTSIFLIAIMGFVLKGSFFSNFIPGGNIGELFSGGFIPLVYTLVAFKVGAELSGIFHGFYKDGEEHA